MRGSRRARYLLALERAAWGHLTTLSCCMTLLDAIGHVTRKDGDERFGELGEVADGKDVS